MVPVWLLCLLNYFGGIRTQVEKSNYFLVQAAWFCLMIWMGVIRMRSAEW